MVVQAIWPGASIQEMEDQVVNKIERKLQETPHIDWVKSYTRAGSAIITLQVKGDTNSQQVADAFYQVRKKVGDISNELPQGLLGPYFNDEFGDTFITLHSISGDGYSYPELKKFAIQARDMWIDATVAASFVADPKQSQVADKVGFALAPDKGLGKRGNWLWAWSLAIPAGSQKAEAAEKFVAWATSKEYSNLVAEKEGWLNAPPGTRKSLYANADYQKAAPFAKMTLDSIESADPTKPTVKPVPYVGVQFVAIPEFQGIGTAVGQQFSAALAGQLSVDQALKSAQQLATREMTKAGYIK